MISEKLWDRFTSIKYFFGYKTNNDSHNIYLILMEMEHESTRTKINQNLPRGKNKNLLIKHAWQLRMGKAEQQQKWINKSD